MVLRGKCVIILVIVASIRAEFRGYKWVPAVFNKNVPEDAVIGGHAEDHNIVFREYVARGKHEGEIIPGKLANPKLVNYPREVHYFGEHKFVDTTLVGGDFHCVYNNTEYWKPEFEILTGPDQFEWVNMSPESTIPENAIVGGQKNDGTIYYIGRGKHDGKNKELGKVDGKDKKLYTMLANTVKIWGYYEILTWSMRSKGIIPLINTISIYSGNHNWIMPDDGKHGILNNDTSTVTTSTQNQSSKTTDPIIDKLLQGISANSNKNITLIDHLKIYQGNHNWIYYHDEDTTRKPANTDDDPDQPTYPIDVRSFNEPKAE